MMNNKYYSCSICGKKFENYAKKQCHQEICGMVGLDKFTDKKPVEKLTLHLNKLY